MGENSIYLIDGHSQLFKAFFAVRGLTTPDGMPANAIFGFANIINRIIDEFTPGAMCVCFDLPGKTFRNDMYPEYKANRPPAPEDLNIQTPYAKRFVEARGLRRLEMVNYESDDLLATLACRAAAAGIHAYIVTADKDLLQVVGERVSVVKMSKGKFDVFDSDRVLKEYGVPPSMMTDYQGLIGDSSDNIPGVKGVGPKTALKLLDGKTSLEDLYEHVEEVENKRIRGLLIEHADNARLSKELATLKTDLDLEIGPEDCLFKDSATPELLAFYKEMGFARLRDATAKALGVEATPAIEEKGRAVDTVTDVIWTADALAAWVTEAREVGRFAFDTETTGVNSLQADLVGISLAHTEGRAVYIPVGHQPEQSEQPQLPLEVVREALAPLFADVSVAKIAQNAKFDMHMLERHGMPVENVVFDPMIASYLVDPDARHGLKSMSRQWLGIEMTEILELIGSGARQITMDAVAVSDAAPYAAADADMTLRLVAPLKKSLDDAALTRMFQEIEMPLAPVLARMEAFGVGLDAACFTRLSEQVDGRLEELRGQAYELAGREFNLDSTQQLATLLFEELDLPAKKRGKTGFSTDVSVLEELSPLHPLPKLMLEYRANKKLQSTYVDALPELVNPETRRIHTSFNQTVAATGRLSSSDPNLQNIPVRTALGRKVREGFVPSAAGRVFLAADYSQIELRVLAHVTGEPALVDAFAQDADIHALTASKVFDVSIGDVSDEMRSQAKTVNFGVIYGMSAMRLSRQLGISMGKAAAFIRDYFAAYPAVKVWTKEVVAKATDDGYVTTLTGRRRYLPNLKSRSPQIRANAERIAVNTPIQGTAADMIKIAMLRLDQRLRDENVDAAMVLQVHDELIFDTAAAVASSLTEIVVDEMTHALPLSIPLKVDVKTGANWAEC